MPGGGDNETLHFRGLANLDATLEHALTYLGLDQATEVRVMAHVSTRQPTSARVRTWSTRAYTHQHPSARVSAWSARANMHQHTSAPSSSTR